MATSNRTKQGNAKQSGSVTGGQKKSGSLQRSSRILFTISAVVILTEFVVIAFGLKTSPFMDVRNVEVVGSRNASLLPDESAAIKRASALPAHTNVFSVPRAAIIKRLQAMPWVAGAQVTHMFPFGVRVTANVRKPAFIVSTPTASYETDSSCVPIRTARPEAQAGLVHIICENDINLVPGQRIPGKVVEMAAALIANFHRATGEKLTKIDIDREYKVWLNVDNGLRINFGSESKPDEKLAAIKTILREDETHGQRFSELNVTSPEYPACRLKVEVAKAAAEAAQAAKLAQSLPGLPTTPGTPAANGASGAATTQ